MQVRANLTGGCDNPSSAWVVSQIVDVKCEVVSESLPNETWNRENIRVDFQNDVEEVELGSSLATMSMAFNHGSVPGLEVSDSYIWTLIKPNGNVEQLGTFAKGEGPSKTLTSMGRYRFQVEATATGRCKVLSPTTYTYKVDVNPPCPATPPSILVNNSSASLPLITQTSHAPITLKVGDVPYRSDIYYWLANDFPSEGVEITPAVSDRATYSADQEFSLRFTKSGRYEFGVRGKNNCYNLPDKVIIYVFFTDELDDYGFGISQTCPPTLPDDIGPLLREFLTKDQIREDMQVVLDEVEESVASVMLKDFRWTVESSIGVIVKPGVVLTDGAELIVERGDADGPAGYYGDDLAYNFTQQTVYDDFGNVIGENKQYFDALGRGIQSQTKNRKKGVLLATQTLYDRYGRASVTTLPAPIRAYTEAAVYDQACPEWVKAKQFVQFGYQNNLLVDTQGSQYDYFDINENEPVGDAPFTVGWYYSNRNSSQAIGAENLTEDETAMLATMNEDRVAITEHPLSKALYREDGSGEIIGRTLPGDFMYESYVDQEGRNRLRVANTARSEVHPVDATDKSILEAYLAERSNYGLVGTYVAGNHYKQVSTDANGRRSVSYLNRDGQVLIAQYYGEGINVITESKSFYDDAGRLIASIDPKGLETRYEYDFRGRMLSMTEPDAGVTQYVYRRDGSIRFSQNAKQAQENKFSYTHYDRASRPIESGEWQPKAELGVSINMLRQNQDLLEQRIALPEGTVAEVVKTSYDRAVALPEDASVEGPAQFLMGKVSYSEKLQLAEQADETFVLKSVSETWYSYDERGRVVWMVQDIAGLGVKTVDYTYGPVGNVQLVAYQDGEGNDDSFYHYYKYDADTRLESVYTSIKSPVYREVNGLKLLNEAATLAAYDLQARYEYYLHGPLKQVKLADELQTTDYYYTVQGWLKAINNPNDTDNSDQDVFSMQLDYFAGDYTKPGSGIQNLPIAEVDYSGNIQTQSWQQQTGQPTPDYYSYQYGYDQRYQLREALFGSISGGSFVKEDTYSVSGLSYDANGNIQTLLRQGTSLPNDFTGVNKYQYRKKDGVELNQLEKVGTYASYEYNAIGQMVKQQTEPDSEAPTQYIEYDVSGKAVGVYSYAQKNAQEVWQYEEDNLLHRYYYDDKGYRVSKEDKTTGKNTYYVRDALGSLLSTYERQTSTSDIELTEVPVYGASRLGVAHRNTDQTLSYLYELKDHLGNVRSRVMKSEPGVDLVSWHTYYPFGLENQALSSNESSYGLRHRYQSEFAEYDQETKLNHFQLRQYDPVVGRWLSMDPMGQHWSPYLAMGNNPASYFDPDGGFDTRLGAWWYSLWNGGRVAGNKQDGFTVNKVLNDGDPSQGILNSVEVVSSRVNGRSGIKFYNPKGQRFGADDGGFGMNPDNVHDVLVVEMPEAIPGWGSRNVPSSGGRGQKSPESWVTDVKKFFESFKTGDGFRKRWDKLFGSDSQPALQPNNSTEVKEQSEELQLQNHRNWKKMLLFEDVEQGYDSTHNEHFYRSTRDTTNIIPRDSLERRRR